MMEEARALPAWLDVSRETYGRLLDYCRLVEKWNPAINLVAKHSLAQIWDRHILDSAQVFGLAPESARLWLDIGSGAGFPGLVVAILARQRRPDLQMILIESDKRKGVFLIEVARQLDLRVVVKSERIESVAAVGADVLSARALARLTELCGYAHRHLAPGGTAIFLKGAALDEEVAEARLSWAFDLERVESRTDEAASIALMRNITRV